MPCFDEAWAAAARTRDGESVSPELKPLLQEVYSIVVLHPNDLIGLKRGLQYLLQFLSQEGRTNANCWATDLFIGLCEGWERDWVDLEMPEDLHDVLAKMGEALHDTVRDPSVARNFDCLPEQLLEELNRIQINLATNDDRTA